MLAYGRGGENGAERVFRPVASDKDLHRKFVYERDDQLWIKTRLRESKCVRKPESVMGG
jgi:hypothetical protein